MLEKIKIYFNNIKGDRKKMLLAILLVVISFIVIMTIVYVSILINNPDGVKFKNEYENLNNKVSDDGKKYPKVRLPLNNNIKYSNVSEILDIFNDKKDAVIYFGYPSCLYCRSAIEVLCETSKDSKIESIYYLDVEKNENYDELLQILDEKFTVDNDGKEIFAPLVLFVANGEVISYNKGTLSSQNDPYTKLDKYQIEGLKIIYRQGIEDVVKIINIKNSI